MKDVFLPTISVTVGLLFAIQFPAAYAAGVTAPKTSSSAVGHPTSSAKNSAAAPVVKPQFSQAELDQMLAPIALYPDTVLSHVLIAATYPLEIIKATRWLSSQPGMTSEQALKAAENQPWDPSVRALVAFSPLLTKMNNELEWTQKLGDAFLTQQAAVMATVQQLREKAWSTGHLKNQEHISVQRREQEKVIIIEPRQPQVVYIPVYDTRVVYGDWWWREYPPIHWPYGRPASSSVWVYWGSGARVSSSFYFSTFYWPRREIVMIHPSHRPTRYYHYHDIIHHEERRHWRHNPRHRHGVVYPTNYQPTQEYYGGGQRQNVPIDDVDDRRRWAAQQRIEHNVPVPTDHTVSEHEVTADNIIQPIEQTAPVDSLQHTVSAEHENAAATTMPTPIPNADPPAETNVATLSQPVIPESTTVTPSEQVVVPPASLTDDHHSTQMQQNPVFEAAEMQVPQPQPEPVFQQPEPVYQPQPEPVYQPQPEPVFQQPEPVYQPQPEPVFQQPEPVYQPQPEPVFQQPEPVFQQPEPVYQPQPEPVFQQPEPVFQQPEPVFQSPEPVQQSFPEPENQF